MRVRIARTALVVAVGSSLALGATAGAMATVQKRTVTVPSSGALTFMPMTMVASPGRLQLVLRNQSSTGHNLTLQRQNTGSRVGGTATISKGTTSFTVTLAKGRYTYYCSVRGHEAAGMKGTLTVR